MLPLRLIHGQGRVGNVAVYRCFGECVAGVRGVVEHFLCLSIPSADLHRRQSLIMNAFIQLMQKLGTIPHKQTAKVTMQFTARMAVGSTSS